MYGDDRLMTVLHVSGLIKRLPPTSASPRGFQMIAVVRSSGKEEGEETKKKKKKRKKTEEPSNGQFERKPPRENAFPLLAAPPFRNNGGE